MNKIINTGFLNGWNFGCSGCLTKILLDLLAITITLQKQIPA